MFSFLVNLLLFLIKTPTNRAHKGTITNNTIHIIMVLLFSVLILSDACFFILQYLLPQFYTGSNTIFQVLCICFLLLWYYFLYLIIRNILKYKISNYNNLSLYYFQIHWYFAYSSHYPPCRSIFCDDTRGKIREGDFSSAIRANLRLRRK